MNVGLIFAGGVGRRMTNTSKPKQFLELHGKPIIVYTLEIFQFHPEIDSVCVVCVQSYISYMNSLIEKYNLSKVKWIVPGGQTGQISIKNGLFCLAASCPEDTIVLIHDGVRPLINATLVTQNIKCVKENGSAISCTAATETIVLIDENNKIKQVCERSLSVIAKAPQSFYLKEIIAVHKRAEEDQKVNFIDSATLMRHYGFALYTVNCGSENIKITTPSDFYVFRAIVEASENSQIFGL